MVRGFLRALGVSGHVRSPSYTLVETYQTAAATAVHADLYRIAAGTAAESLGLRDYDAGGHIWLIEWPDRGAGLPPADLLVTLAHHEAGRSLVVTAATSLGAEIEAQ